MYIMRNDSMRKMIREYAVEREKEIGKEIQDINKRNKK